MTAYSVANVASQQIGNVGATWQALPVTWDYAGSIIYAVESIGLTEDLERQRVLNRTFVEGLGVHQIDIDHEETENLSITATVSHSIGKVIETSLVMHMDKLGSSGAVMTDIKADAGVAMSEQDFENLMNTDGPAGFGAFEPYQIGDYVLEDAVINYRLHSRSAQQGTFEKLNVSMDVEERLERGEATISAAPTRINFNRAFSSAANVDVVAALIAATGPAIVNIAAKDANGFNVEILDTAGTNITGNVSWQAVGW